MKCVDLFCGVGGLSLGLKLSGIEVLAGIDAWAQALDVYRLNHGHDAIELDLSDVQAATLAIKRYDFDLIAGGPPCQDFSHAGKRVEGSRANLTLSFASLIAQSAPQWFIMENVDRSQNSAAYTEAREIYKKAGYGLTEKVLDASLCGVPQKRKRFFCIGKLGEKDGFLLPIIDKKLAQSPMTVRQYLGAELDIDYYYRHPRNYSRRGVFSVDEPSATIRGVNRPVPKGYPGHANDKIAVGAVRPLTTLERARIQTFPQDYCWRGSKTEIEQFIGNAVPANLARFVGECVLAFMGIASKADYPTLKRAPHKGQMQLCEPPPITYIPKVRKVIYSKTC
jgi:DNA (cytosine-5)-methyltransferase 1